MTKEFIEDLLSKIKEAEIRAGELPGNACFMDGDKVLCLDRERGESRYPYSEDGLVVWLHSTGYIDACESIFTIFKASNFGEGPHVAFFGGIEDGKGYFPVSVTGAARQLSEPGVSRYIVYSLKCAYCIAECENVIFALRLAVDRKKHIRITLSAVNKTDATQNIYLSSFFEAMLRYGENETFWQRMTKFGRRCENGSFILKSVNREEDFLVINRHDSDQSIVTGDTFTTERTSFLGGSGRSLENAIPLKTGRIVKQSVSTTTTDLPVAARIATASLPAFATLTQEYELVVCRSEDEAEAASRITIDGAALDAELAAAERSEAGDFDNLTILFDGWKSGALKDDVFNKFLRCVQKQTSFCAHGKNYAGAYLGIRDVFQQLEGALMWQRDLSREKMLLAMNFILSSGRPPRMFSVPKSGAAVIPVDLEKYIDQGVWIISTFYTYLAHTGDVSILDEVCGYIDAPDEAWCDAHDTGERTTVLEHLVRILEFLLSNIDREYTGCMRVLFGDWNDAVDGLGATEDEGREFGTGVTVMASLQFRQNLSEMTEILSLAGGYDDLIARCAEAKAGIERGLEKYAIDTLPDTSRRIVHGWGDKVSYKVGSFRDPDGKSRHSLTPNSFWAITGFIERDPSLKREIMECFDAVSSKYGLKTFDVPFGKDAKGVGRIRNIVPGTYENSCAYAHGSLFGTMALFALGESERAWREIEKTVVITHPNATMTSFVMPNSYCENAEFDMDGESLGDWHTGSGCVLIKEIVKYAFGICPDLGGIRIQPPKYFPAKRGEINIKIKDTDVTLRYEDRGEGERRIELEGAEGERSFDTLMDIPVVYVPNSSLGEKLTVTVTD
ncbi:MAG: hypothetical protein IJT70_07695 [Clostridia bacterium]|nr:hypothetical protein [Clostridia bacterium]